MSHLSPFVEGARRKELLQHYKYATHVDVTLCASVTNDQVMLSSRYSFSSCWQADRHTLALYSESMDYSPHRNLILMLLPFTLLHPADMITIVKIVEIPSKWTRSSCIHMSQQKIMNENYAVLYYKIFSTLYRPHCTYTQSSINKSSKGWDSPWLPQPVNEWNAPHYNSRRNKTTM